METQTTAHLAQHLRELSAEVEALKAAGPESPRDTLAHWLSAHYAAAARKAAEEAGEGGMPLETLRGLTADVVSLRRGDHHAMRLKIERARLEMDRQTKTEAGLKEIAEQIRGNPKAEAALDVLVSTLKPGGLGADDPA